MKDLTHYLKSPPKPNISETTASKEVKSSSKTVSSASDKSQTNGDATNQSLDSGEQGTSEEKLPSVTTDVPEKCDNKNDSSNQMNKENQVERRSCRKKHKKCKHASRKPSDPGVKNITELLNNSLSIISPNTSINTSAEINVSTTTLDVTKTKKLSNRRSSSDFESPKMSSRKKSAGNSSFKLRSDKETCNTDSKSTDGSVNKEKGNNLLDKSNNKQCSQLETSAIDDNKDFETPKKIKKNASRCKSVDKGKIEKINVKEVKIKKDHISQKDSKSKSTENKKTAREDQSSKSVNKSPKKASKTTENQQSQVSKNCAESSENCVTAEDVKTETPKTKINAFQFMMESRFKSIGQNLEGSEAENLKSPPEEEKERREKCQSRKVMLQSWAESKDETKRKRREEEDKDVYINLQLEKRAKRLKKMLNIDLQNSNDTEVLVEFRPERSCKKKVKPVIETDSENSNNSVENTPQVNIHKNRMSIDSSSKELKQEETKKKIDGKIDRKSTEIKNSSQNKLLSFLGITENLEKPPEGNENITPNKVDNKMPSDKNIKKSDEKPADPSKTPNERLSKLCLKKVVTIDNDNATFQIETAEEHSINITEHREESTLMSLEYDSTNPSQGALTETSCSQESFTHTGDNSKTSKMKKHKKKKYIDDHLLPKSPRHWQMKIRLATDEPAPATEDPSNKATPKNGSESKRNLSDISKYLISNKACPESDMKKTDVEDTEPKIKDTEMIKLPSSDSETDIEIVKVEKVASNESVKLAPVFLKKTPKPKMDPKVAEARRQFLLSGIPDRLKRDMERQISLEDLEYDFFPTISHVQQKSPSNKFWEMPKVSLDLKDPSPLKHNAENLVYDSLTDKNTHYMKIDFVEETNKIPLNKALIDQIKSENTEYPVYKCFKSIYKKSGLSLRAEKQKKDGKKKKTPKKRESKRKRSSKADDSVIVIEDTPENIEIDYSKYMMWTEKYKPQVSADVIGNASSVLELKKFLEKWIDEDDETGSRKKRKRRCSSSESEFAYSDSDSRSSFASSVKNTIILRGPLGSGKSSAVYAVCNELGMNVLELNASSKRTGKRLLQELQEATQSHQVRKNKSTSLAPFIKVNKPKQFSQPEESQSSQKKICVLLVEDVDIVFDQDDGFLYALSQLILTSKRPIILTTTNHTSQNIQKFMAQYPVISFNALTAFSLATWLQIVCLVEGVALDRKSIGILLERNHGDVRRTLLELQYWVESGGDLRKLKTESPFNPSQIKSKRASCDEKFVEDDSNLSSINIETSEGSVVYQDNLLDSFETINPNKSFHILYEMNCSKIWWNLPNILCLETSESSISSTPDTCLSGESNSDSGVEPDSGNSKKNSDKEKLKAISRIYDSLLIADLTLNKKHCMRDLEPCPRQWDNKLVDSLELKERLEDYYSNEEFSNELCHTLTNGYIDVYRRLNKRQSWYNLGVPTTSDKRWRAKQHLCEDILQDALPISSYVDRRATALDYMPQLRNITRSEMVRASLNTKRNNRFNNYLKNLGVDGGDGSYKLICNVLNINRSK